MNRSHLIKNIMNLEEKLFIPIHRRKEAELLYLSIEELLRLYAMLIELDGKKA